MKKYLLFFTAIILSMLATSCDGKFTSTIVVENSSKAEKEIDETCGKGNPVEFRNCDTILFSWDGKTLINKGETELD